MIEIKNPADSYKEFPGPILLLAGPGTGKTFQLAKRIKFLIEEMKVDPTEIVVVTFTGEAARNMKERLAEPDINIDKEKYPGIISTMHSLGNMILSSAYPIFNLPENYKILVEDERKIPLIQDATYMVGCDMKKWEEVRHCRLGGSCVQNDSDKCKICEEYKKILRKCSCVDFDDLILLAYEALKKDTDLKSSWKKKTKYLLVDEYQDINEAQCDLMRLLSENQEEGLFVVGDDEQSIYSFRGGSPKFISNFEKYYPKSPKIGKLFMSWRCPRHILLGARSMISNFYKNAVPKPKPEFIEKMKLINNKIIFYEVPTEEKEAQIIAAISKDKIKNNSIKIIIPNSKYLPVIKKELQNIGLNYKYKLSVNEDGLSRFTILMDWANNVDDNIIFRHLLDLIVKNHDEIIKKVNEDEGGITKKRVEAHKIIAKLWEEVNEAKSLYKVFNEKSLSNNFLKELNESLDSLKILILDNGGKKASLVEFLKMSGFFVAPGKNPNNLINEINEWINDLVGSSKVVTDEPILIYNMPSSKGLEADIIFVIGLSKQLFPNPEDDIEEKSRLFYVAMTRAKKELYLFSSRTRSSKITFNKISYQLEPSSFIDAICKDNIEIRKIFPKR